MYTYNTTTTTNNNNNNNNNDNNYNDVVVVNRYIKTSADKPEAQILVRSVTSISIMIN